MVCPIYSILRQSTTRYFLFRTDLTVLVSLVRFALGCFFHSLRPVELPVTSFGKDASFLQCVSSTGADFDQDLVAVVVLSPQLVWSEVHRVVLPAKVAGSHIECDKQGVNGFAWRGACGCDGYHYSRWFMKVTLEKILFFVDLEDCEFIVV